MNVLYESDRLLVIDKPAGITTIPDRMGSDSVHGQLQRERNTKLWVVHRLDREVSGVLLFAKEPEAHRTLSMMFEQHLIRKKYEALTDGDAPAEPANRWQNLLLRGKKRSYESPHGKLAITEANYAGYEPSVRALRWFLTPLTGRNHQLRVHLAQHGYPIVGDLLYGNRRDWRPNEIALRAVELVMPEGEGLPALTVTAPGFV